MVNLSLKDSLLLSSLQLEHLDSLLSIMLINVSPKPLLKSRENTCENDTRSETFASAQVNVINNDSFAWPKT